MQFKKSLLTATLLTVASLTAISSANAATDEAAGSFDVKMTVAAACSVVAGESQDINFSSITAATTAEAVTVAAPTGILVTCSKNAPYTVNLQSTTNASLTGAGTMTGPVGPNAEPAETIAYQLLNASSENWGKTVGVSGIGAGLAVIANSHIVSTQLTAASTEVRPGLYTDTVNVFITY